MILLDTNVVSEAFRAAPDPLVIAWMDRQAIGTLYLSTVTVAELRFGIAMLATGKRRDVLARGVENDLLPLFEGRILPFDLDASLAYAELMSRARLSGRAIGMADGYIAAIAAARGLDVATGDTGPFEAAGLRTLNPWSLLA